MPVIKPPRLSQGKTFGIIAPASPGQGEDCAAGLQWLTAQGFTVRTGSTVCQQYGYLAARDEDRAADLHEMFANPDVDGIVCLRGGYGTMRLLELIDYELIRQNPKVFVGYSDITALHTAINQRTGLITFHGPMVESDMKQDMPAYTGDHFLQAISSDQPLGLIDPPQEQRQRFITGGSAEGRLAGGNLSIIAAMMGTPYELDTEGKILCLEDVGEAPYRIDRMLTQLLLAGKLQSAAGIVVDVFSYCDEEGRPGSFTVEEVLTERLGGLEKPVLINVMFGHTPVKATLPFGAKARLGNEGGGLVIIETATS